MAAFFLRYVELILTGVGLLIIVLVMYLIPSTHTNKWFVVSWVAIIIGALHGVIFFVIRNRQRVVRTEAIYEVSLMLQDKINNHMMVIMNLSGSSDQSKRKLVDEAIHDVSHIVNTLSEESLTSWKNRYKKVLAELRR
jgi:ABC-type iron transport system FetAB permease component